MCCLHNSLRVVFPSTAVCGAVAFCCKSNQKDAHSNWMKQVQTTVCPTIKFFLLLFALT